jgi:predicted RecA/RadA family phage recombinase
MRNFVSHGDTMNFPAPYDVASGEGALIGALFGVAVAAYKANDPKAQFKTTGVITLPKTSAQAWTAGQKIYWDATNKVVTSTATSNTLIGVAASAAANPSAAGDVRLNGVAA